MPSPRSSDPSLPAPPPLFLQTRMSESSSSPLLSSPLILSCFTPFPPSSRLVDSHPPSSTASLAENDRCCTAQICKTCTNTHYTYMKQQEHEHEHKQRHINLRMYRHECSRLKLALLILKMTSQYPQAHPLRCPPRCLPPWVVGPNTHPGLLLVLRHRRCTLNMAPIPSLERPLPLRYGHSNSKCGTALAACPNTKLPHLTCSNKARGTASTMSPCTTASVVSRHRSRLHSKSRRLERCRLTTW